MKNSAKGNSNNVKASLISGIPNNPKNDGKDNHIMNLRAPSFLIDVKYCVNAANINRYMEKTTQQMRKSGSKVTVQEKMVSSFTNFSHILHIDTTMQPRYLKFSSVGLLYE